MPAHPGRRQRRRRGRRTREFAQLEDMFPAENPDNIQSGRPNSSVEVRTENAFEALTHVKDRHELQIQTSRQAEGVNKDPRTKTSWEGQTSTNHQEVRLPPRPIFKTASSEGKSEVRHDKAQATEENQGNCTLETQPKVQAPPSVPAFTFEIQPDSSRTLNKTNSSPSPLDVAAQYSPSREYSRPRTVDSGIGMCTPRSPADLSPSERTSGNTGLCTPSNLPETPQFRQVRHHMTFGPQNFVPRHSQRTHSVRQHVLNSNLDQCTITNHVYSPPSHSFQPQEKSFHIQSNGQAITHSASGPSFPPMASRTRDGRITVPPGFESLVPPRIPGIHASTAAAAVDRSSALLRGDTSLSNLSRSSCPGFYPRGESNDHGQNGGNPFIPISSARKPHELSDPLLNSAPTIEQGRTNGVLFLLYANTAQTHVRSAKPIASNDCTKHQKSTHTPEIHVKDVFAERSDETAFYLPNLVLQPGRALMKPQDRPRFLFDLARRAEEERLDEKELNKYLFGANEIPGLGHGVTQIVKDELPPNLLYSKPIVYESGCNGDEAGCTQGYESPVLVGNDEGTIATPDDGWELVEWPLLSGLLWKSSGLDRLTVELNEAPQSLKKEKKRGSMHPGCP